MPKKSKRAFGNLFWLIVPIGMFVLLASYLFSSSEQVEESSAAILASRAYEATATQEESFVWKGEGLLTFWFDDAWLSQYTEGYYILKDYGYKAALAVPTHLVGYPAYMNWFQIRKLHFLGWEITAHSRNHHCDLVDGGRETFEYEMLGSKLDLKENGILTEIYVAPCGKNNQDATFYVKEHFSAQRIVEPGQNKLPVQDRYSIQVRQVSRGTNITEVVGWIKEAARNRTWLILMLHQIDHADTFYGTTPEILEEIALRVKDSNLSVVLPSQVLNIK